MAALTCQTYSGGNIYRGTLEKRSQAAALFTVVGTLALPQLISSPRRDSDILDMFLTSDELIMNDVRLEEIEISDHRIIVTETIPQVSHQACQTTTNKTVYVH